MKKTTFIFVHFAGKQQKIKHANTSSLARSLNSFQSYIYISRSWLGKGIECFVRQADFHIYVQWMCSARQANGASYRLAFTMCTVSMRDTIAISPTQNIIHSQSVTCIPFAMTNRTELLLWFDFVAAVTTAWLRIPPCNYHHSIIVAVRLTRSTEFSFEHFFFIFRKK